MIVKERNNTLALKNVFSKKKADPFNPFTSWENRYRIWPNIYFLKHGIETNSSGYLTIKKAFKSDDIIELTVEQRLRLEEDSHFYSAHILKATILCKTDDFATPISWEWTSSYKHNVSDTEILRLHETAVYKEGHLERETRNGVFHTAIQGQFSLDWCLLEAIQRGEADLKSPFTIFEKFSLLRSNQHIKKAANKNNVLPNEFHHLTRYIRKNNGINHQEYWLNEQNRLISFSNGNRIYLLEDSTSQNYNA